MKEIILRSGERCVISEEDFQIVARYRWYATKKHNGIYASARINHKMVQMHRLVMGICDPKIQVDHKDGNKLNNQRINLRLCNNGQNSRNRKAYGESKLKGVERSSTNRWRARIVIDGKRIHLGSFTTKEDAAKAFNYAALLSGDEFYRLNEIKQ